MASYTVWYYTEITCSFWRRAQLVFLSDLLTAISWVLYLDCGWRLIHMLCFDILVLLNAARQVEFHAD